MSGQLQISVVGLS